jgi:hypothetical protein
VSGRKPTTGRFATREELETFVHAMAGDFLQKDIAVEAGISEAMVSELLNTRKQRAITHFRKLQFIRR